MMMTMNRLHSLLTARALFFALLTAIALGCGGTQTDAEEPGESAGAEGEGGSSEDDGWEDWDDEPGSAGTEYTGSAIEQLGISGPDTPWEEMNDEEKEWYMVGRVLPIMHEIFARQDAERYHGFSCESCHGDDMREVHYEMPSGSFYRLPEPGSSGWTAMERTFPEQVRFMREEVTPTMGTLLGIEDYTCFHCHTRR